MKIRDVVLRKIQPGASLVGFRNKKAFSRFKEPLPTHSCAHFNKSFKQVSPTSDLFSEDLPRTMGVREALGLSDIGFDDLAPTLRSTFTGKRNTSP